MLAVRPVVVPLCTARQIRESIVQRAPPAHCSPNGLTSVPALPLLPPWASQIAGLEDAALFAAEANAARNAFLARAPGAQHMVRSSSAHIPGALESTEKATSLTIKPSVNVFTPEIS